MPRPLSWSRLFRAAGTASLLVRDFVISIPAFLLAAPFWLLSWRSAAVLGRFYGRCAFILWPAGRRVSMINLRRAYGPSMSRRRARLATLAALQNLCASMAEGAQFARRSRAGHPAAIIEPDDPKLVEQILADLRPKIFVTGHLGSWEIAVMALSMRGLRGATVARRIDNPFLNAVVRNVRLNDPSQWIEKKGAVEEALARLRAGDNVAMLLDENGGERGPFIDFFGRPASTRKTAALLSLMTGAPIVLGAALRMRTRSGEPRFRYRLAWIDPQARGWRGPSATLPITEEIVRTWESWVRHDPLQWRWVHWRWKRRPDGSNETYGPGDLAAAFGKEER